MICKVARRVLEQNVFRSPERVTEVKRLLPKTAFKRVGVKQVFREVKPCR